MGLVKRLLRRARVETFIKDMGKEVDEMCLRYDDRRVTEAEKSFLKDMEGDIVGFLIAEREAEGHEAVLTRGLLDALSGNVERH